MDFASSSVEILSTFANAGAINRANMIIQAVPLI